MAKLTPISNWQLRDLCLDGKGADPVILSQIFHPQTVRHEERCRAIFVPVEIFQRCNNVLKYAKAVIEDIDRVMADREHAEIVQGARRLGLRMPDVDLFMRDFEEFRCVFDNFEPLAVENRGAKVKVPIETASAIDDIMKRSCFLVARILEDCFETDYLKSFTVYKKQGIPYEGPNALQSTVHLLVSMASVHNRLEQYIEAGLAERDWRKYMQKTPSGESLGRFGDGSDDLLDHQGNNL